MKQNWFLLPVFKLSTMFRMSKIILYSNQMVIKLLAHVKPGMRSPGQRLLRKESVHYFNEEGVSTPKPTLVKFEEPKT